MKLKVLLMILILNCCTNGSVKNDLNKEIIFSEKMSFEEFKSRLNEYAIISPYPDIKN